VYPGKNANASAVLSGRLILRAIYQARCAWLISGSASGTKPSDANNHRITLGDGGIHALKMTLPLKLFILTLAKPRRLFHCRAMQSHELLREVFEKASPKQVAADLGLSLSMIYKWAEPPEHVSGSGPGSGTGNPLDRIQSLLESTGDQRLVQWICQRAGGFFILNPKNTPHPHFLIPATNQIVQEFADLLHVIATATADEKITPAEARQIRERWEELKTVTESFVTCCEEGNFDPLKKTEGKLAKRAPRPVHQG
jgi:hypothetical protein